MLNVNILVSILSIIILLMTLVCRNKFISQELFYMVIIIDLLILMASLKEKFDEKFFPNYEIIPNRHPKKFIRNKNCFLRNKEYSDYNQNIDKRLDEERKMEEMDRKSMIFKNEMDKLLNMGDDNLEYIVNGENF